MIEIEFAADFTVSHPDGFVLSDDQVVSQSDLVMEELVKLTDANAGVEDPALSLDLGTGVVTIEVTARGIDIDAATAVASSCIRSAIHASGGATAGWELQKRGQRAELLNA